MKCMMSCVRNLPGDGRIRHRHGGAVIDRAGDRGTWRAGTDGRLAALVERAASHGVASTSVIDAAAAAKDIALY